MWIIGNGYFRKKLESFRRKDVRFYGHEGFFENRILASSCRQQQKLGYYGRTVGTSTYNFLIIWVIIIAKIMAKEVAFHLQMIKKCEEIIINDKSAL